MVQQKPQTPRQRYLFLIGVVLTLLMPALPFWRNDVGAGYLIATFVVSAAACYVSFERGQRWLALILLNCWWQGSRYFFFTREEARYLLLPITLQTLTTFFVASIGVTWFCEHLRGPKQLRGIHKVLKS